MLSSRLLSVDQPPSKTDFAIRVLASFAAPALATAIN
jgi:hypothetical protein